MAANLSTGDPITRDYLQQLQSDAQRAIAESKQFMPGEGGALSSEGLNTANLTLKYAGDMLQLLDQYGVNSLTDLPPEIRAQVPNQGQYVNRGGGSVGNLVWDFITSAPVLVAAGGLAGIAGAGAAGASAGAAETGAAAGTAAGTEAALGTGITAGATGASGLSATAGGASGISATGAAGTSLAPGFFAAETAYPVIGGLTASASGSGATTGTGSTGVSGSSGGNTSGTALQRILDGKGTTADYLALTGQIAPSLLGMYASGKQTDALRDQAARYEALGAPYRSRLAELYADPNAFLTSPEVTVPVQQGTDIVARSLSTQGNPIASGNALQKLQSYSADQLFGRLGQEKDRLAGFGGLATYNAAAPAAATNAIGSQANFYNAAGAGIADIFGTRRQRSLADLLREGGY